MAKARQFVEIFNIDTEKNCVNFSPSLFFCLRIYNDAIKSGRITYADTGINGDYYDSFASAAAEEAKHYVKELKKLSERTTTTCTICSVEYLDYNLLDYLEGAIKSACDNQITTWDQLELRDKNHFDEIILLIKDKLSENDNIFFLKEKLRQNSNYHFFDSYEKVTEDGLLAEWLPYREEITQDDENAVNLFDSDENINDHDYIAKQLHRLVPEEFIDEETTDSLRSLAGLNPEDLQMKVLSISDYGRVNPIDIIPTGQKNLELDLIGCEYNNTVNTLRYYNPSDISSCEKA
ncbi:MAG: hypothetical protein WCO55_04345 [Candidatus Falkowbacteria bacterium]